MQNRFTAAAAALAILVSAACASPPVTSPPASPTITVCGSVEADRREARVALILRDARSGSRFGLAIPAAAEPEFVQALGGEPEDVLDGASVCATGILRGDDTLEVAAPGDLTVQSRREQ